MGFSAELLCVVSPLSSPEIQLLVSFCSYNCDKENNKDWHFLLPFTTHTPPATLPPSSLLLCSGARASITRWIWELEENKRLKHFVLEKGKSFCWMKDWSSRRKRGGRGHGQLGSLGKWISPKLWHGLMVCVVSVPIPGDLKEGVHSQLSYRKAEII